MDDFGLVILTLLWSLALINFCQILLLLTLRSLIFITRKSIARATFILGCSLVTCNFILSCSLVTWNLAISVMLAKGWGWKMYWPIFYSTCGLTFCIIYAIFHYNPPPRVSNTRQLKLGLFDHLNSHQLINYVKGLFNYVNPPCRRPENANVVPSQLKDLSPADVQSPKKFWWSAIWLALIRPEKIAYKTLTVSLCLLLWTVTFFDMVAMNSGWPRRVWSCFVTTCYMISMMYVDILMDNSPEPISHTRRVTGVFDRLNPSVVKGLFNHINITRRSAESAQDATDVAFSHLTDQSPAVIESPECYFLNFVGWDFVMFLRKNSGRHYFSGRTFASMIFMVSLSLLNWSVTIIAMKSRWEMTCSSLAVMFGVIFMIYVEGLVDHRSRRLTENANLMAPCQLTDLSPARVQSPNVIPDINAEKGEGKATKQEAAAVYSVENNEKSKCQRNETDLDNAWEIIEEAEINERHLEVATPVV